MGALNGEKPQPFIAVRTLSRIPTQRPAIIIVASNLPPIMCTVIDISEAGAGLWVGSTFGIPDNFDLLIEGDSIKRACRVIWKETHKFGVQFK
jgi:hypothetical protein